MIEDEMGHKSLMSLLLIALIQFTIVSAKIPNEIMTNKKYTPNISVLGVKNVFCHHCNIGNIIIGINTNSIVLIIALMYLILVIC